MRQARDNERAASNGAMLVAFALLCWLAMALSFSRARLSKESIGAYCAELDKWGGVGDGVGSYFRGRPRDRWRRLTNSASSTIQNEPKSSS